VHGCASKSPPPAAATSRKIAQERLYILSGFADYPIANNAARTLPHQTRARRMAALPRHIFAGQSVSDRGTWMSPQRKCLPLLRGATKSMAIAVVRHSLSRKADFVAVWRYPYDSTGFISEVPVFFGTYRPDLRTIFWLRRRGLGTPDHTLSPCHVVKVQMRRGGFERGLPACTPSAGQARIERRGVQL